MPARRWPTRYQLCPGVEGWLVSAGLKAVAGLGLGVVVVWGLTAGRRLFGIRGKADGAH